jgi:hypothetical protein
MPSTLITPQRDWQVAYLTVTRSTQSTTGVEAVITLQVAGSAHPAVFHLTAEHVDALLEGLKAVVKSRRNAVGV